MRDSSVIQEIEVTTIVDYPIPLKKRGNEFVMVLRQEGKTGMLGTLG
jgi:hypothetical protein